MVWLAEYKTALLPRTAQILALNSGGMLWARIQGLVNLSSTLFLMLLPAGLIAAGFFKFVRRSKSLGCGELLLGRFLATGLALLFVAVVVGGTARFHERWLQPFLMFVPLLVFSRYEFVRAGISRRFGFVLIAIALVSAGARTAQVFVGGRDRGTYPLQMKFAPVVAQLQPLVGPGTVIVSRDREIAGNLRYYIPGARHLCSSRPLYLPPLQEFRGPRILIWNAIDGTSLPADLRAFATETLHLPPLQDVPVKFADLPPKLAGRRLNRLAFLYLEEPLLPR
jgi:hypothetical protein